CAICSSTVKWKPLTIACQRWSLARICRGKIPRLASLAYDPIGSKLLAVPPLSIEHIGGLSKIAQTANGSPRSRLWSAKWELSFPPSLRAFISGPGPQDGCALTWCGTEDPTAPTHQSTLRTSHSQVMICAIKGSTVLKSCSTNL